MTTPNLVVHAVPRTGSYSMVVLARRASQVRAHHVHYLQNHHYYWNKASSRNTINEIGREAYKVICTIRDPVARNLSEYWRRWQVDANPKNAMKIVKKLGLRRKEGNHYEKFRSYIDHWRQHHFFGGELIPFWGIDIFARPFEAPYQIYDDRLLVIRCEDMDEYGPQAIGDLLGIEVEMPMFHLNVVPAQREPIALSETYLDAMYENGEHSEKFPGWFYSDDELEEFRKKWKG